MIKAVIFDYGGVMDRAVSVPTEISGVYDITVEEFLKFSELTIPVYSLLNKGLISEKKFWEDISVSIKRSLPKNWKKLARGIYEKSFSLVPEMIELIKELKDKGIKTAVLSNIAEYQAEIIRRHKGYAEFDVEVLSYKEKLRKPEQEIYTLVIKKLKVKPGECIFIDDKERNLPPAQLIGIKTVLFKNPKQAVKEVLAIISK